MLNVSTVIILKPISAVWDFYNNPANYTLWLSAFSQVEIAVVDLTVFVDVIIQGEFRL